MSQQSRLPVNTVAAVLADTNEELLEAVVAEHGGLLPFLKSHSKDFSVRKDLQSRWTVQLLQPSQRFEEVPPIKKPALATKRTTDTSPVALFWKAFDNTLLVPFLPDRWVKLSSVVDVLPKEWTDAMPSEQRAKNLIAAIRPFADVAFGATVTMVRLRHDCSHPKKDVQGALMLLSDALPDISTVMQVSQRLPRSPMTSLGDLPGVVPAFLLEKLGPSPIKTLRMFPTLFCTAVFTGSCGMVRARHVASYTGPDLVASSEMMSSSELASKRRDLGRRVRTLLQQRQPPAKDMASFITTTEKLADLCSKDEAELGTGSTATLSSLIDSVGGLASVISECTDSLPINDDGMIDLRIGQTKPPDEPAALASSGDVFQRPVNPESCRGKSIDDLYAPASESAIDKFCTITKTRWTNKLKEVQKARKNCRDPNSPLKHPEALAKYMWSLCSQDDWVLLSVIGERMTDDAKAWMPVQSFLHFMLKYPHYFDLVESFTKHSTDYLVRGRKEGEEFTGGGIAKGNYSSEEINAFIDHCLNTKRNMSSLANLWSKLPYSVRRQLGSSTRLEEYLSERPALYCVDKVHATVRMATQASNPQALINAASDVENL